MKTIPLTRNQIATVDDSEYESLSRHKWYARQNGHTNSFYACRAMRLANGKTVIERMHRRILGLEHDDPRVSDHINHDTLDNRRSNLRIASVAQNNYNQRTRRDNTSGFRGVTWNSRDKIWQVRIGAKRLHVGNFATLKDANAAYLAAAKSRFGEFMCPTQ